MARAIASRGICATRETHAVFTGQRAVAVRQRHDEIMQADGAGNFDDRFLRRVGLAQPDIFAHGDVEERIFLQHHAHAGAQRTWVTAFRSCPSIAMKPAVGS